jgi:peptidoglycan hydrolase CwlO-like protein
MHFTQKKQIVPILAIILVMVFSNVFAQTTAIPLTPEEKTQLQQQLQDIENQIKQYQQELSQISGEKNTLQNKLKQLQKQQASLALQMQATNLKISAIHEELSTTEKAIETNVTRSKRLKKQLVEYIRLIYQQDSDSLFYILLSQDNLSDVLNELENTSQISQSLNSVITEIQNNNKELTAKQDELAMQNEEANNLLSIQNLQRGQIAGTASEHSSLLAETKGKESAYQATLRDTQKLAAQIRSRLYPLLQTGKQISFGEAVQIAQYASSLTGVRASFLLAILTQESNLGKNVGTCNRPGDPAEKSYKVVMKPTRDIQPFLQITDDLGLDPETTPVSCPMRNKDGSFNGWGGAMGPAQFIPSTWMGYKDKVAAITGKTANPWDIRDAFVAAAIKLKAGGAGTVEGEWAAAMRYFSGGTNTKYRFYGDNVVATANQYQKDIENLGQ